ncbi:MAG: 2-hydroxyacyl-CoA dehydratase family protein [Pseudomonadota bacterium]
MNKSDPWVPFADIIKDPWSKVKTAKAKTGKKIIGHLLPDVPEELIHAAGAIPIAVAGAGIPINQAQAQIPGYSCSHAMGAVELRLTGELDVLDGMIIPYVCDTTRNLYHLWRNLFPDFPCEFLRLPKKIADLNANRYLKEEFFRISRWLEGITGNKIVDEALVSSISIYNKSRAQLRSAYQMMETSPSSWTTGRVISLFESACKVPREDLLTLLEPLPWNVIEDSNHGRSRIYVRGKVWDPLEITELFDENGFIVVGDEIVTGQRSVITYPILQEDPMQSLVDRHMSLIPYTGYHIEPKQIIDDFLARVKKSKAQGVVFLNPKFCEAAAFDTPDLTVALKENSIPNIVLETSSRGTSISQIRLRLEAFREILSDDLP